MCRRSFETAKLPGPAKTISDTDAGRISASVRERKYTSIYFRRAYDNLFSHSFRAGGAFPLTRRIVVVTVAGLFRESAVGKSTWRLAVRAKS
jgi:hypothetical protein